MRILKITTLFIVILMSFSAALSAKTNKYGVSDVRKVSFAAAMRVGDVLLPAGDYEVRHVMEAENHIMVFKKLNTSKPAEARVKCNLVTLKQKAEHDEVIYQINASNERVLQTLRFRGDLAEHVF
jgi:hypothetical protein